MMHDSPRENSIEMLCLPLGQGVATPGRVAGEIRVNGCSAMRYRVAPRIQ